MRHTWIVAAVAALALTLLGARSGHADPGGLAIAYGKTGIKLGDESIFAGDVEGAAWDPGQELIWFKSKGTLSVIDLRAKTRKPVAIAKKMPPGAFGVSGVSTAGWNTDYAGIYPVIVVGKKPKVGQDAGAYGEIWEDQDKAARKLIKKVKIVGARWLKAQAKRKARPLSTPVNTEVVGKVTLPAGTECEDDDTCGEARAFGGTGLQLVVTEYGCGDACHMSCVLYDPKSKKFTSPSAGGAWSATPSDEADCFDYQFSPSGTSYVSGSSRCEVGKTISCTSSADWAYVGWVDGGTSSTGSPAEAAIAGMQVLRDDMCRCTNKACATKVHTRFEALLAIHKDTTGTPEQTAQLKKVAEEYAKCMGTANAK